MPTTSCAVAVTPWTRIKNSKKKTKIFINARYYDAFVVVCVCVCYWYVFFLLSHTHSVDSSHKYAESEVTLQYRRPVRNEIKVEWSEEDLAVKQAEAMRRIYQEERRRKYLQELQDMSNRRHADNLLWVLYTWFFFLFASGNALSRFVRTASGRIARGEEDNNYSRKNCSFLSDCLEKTNIFSCNFFRFSILVRVERKEFLVVRVKKKSAHFAFLREQQI